MNQAKILSKLNQLELLGGLIIKEATMLKQELLGVVSDNSPRKGKKLSDIKIAEIKAKSESRRLGIK